MRDLVDTTETYLHTIFEFEEESIISLRAHITERLEQSGPTVSQTVARMECDSLLAVAPDRSLQLSDEGRGLATAVMRKHRLAERLLTDVIGPEWDKVHDEACRREYIISDEVEYKLLDVLDSYTRFSFSNPTPGLEDLGGTQLPGPLENVRRLSDLNPGEHTIEIVQINEILQVEQSYMKCLHKAGIMPDNKTLAGVTAGRVTLARGDHSLDIPDSLSHAIMVIIK